MKKVKFIISIIVLLTIATTIEAQQRTDMVVYGEQGSELFRTNIENIDSIKFEAVEEGLSLINTKWKLAGVVDIENNIIRVLEPIHCEECYTLTFTTDYIASVRSINIMLELDFSNLVPSPSNDMLFCERYFEDGVDYCDSDTFRRGIERAEDYLLIGNQLILFNYLEIRLLFNSLNTIE